MAKGPVRITALYRDSDGWTAVDVLKPKKRTTRLGRRIQRARTRRIAAGLAFWRAMEKGEAEDAPLLGRRVRLKALRKAVRVYMR